MDASYKMTVTINQLVSPLLHDALSGCHSARARAMRLRALAESALRQPVQRDASHATPQPSGPPVVARSRTEATVSQETGVQILRVDDFATNASAGASSL
ncbi:hypothetical protein, partial [Burkholderia gladioli]|uniref:hypothetical protein n=1 Tax=Burkholderia gladioli TaxID=28095 RepID=UPI001ABACD24